AAEQDFHLRYMGKVQVKGKEVPLDIYECLDADPPNLKALKLKHKQQFDEGIQYFLDASFAKAESLFKKIIETNPDDGAALHFHERARQLALQGVHSEWTGVEEVLFK
ncbi:MAG: hypothetical protein R3330_08655, partial [Saprospiraceae bacterium]|nr:hypothetical protein [Saprospiraceae bacterium]